MQVLGFAGYSGSGKTTLIEQLIPRFVAFNQRVSLVKHAHHTFDIDTPGKDSFRHREAGASEVLISSRERWVLMKELRGEQEPDLQVQLDALSPCDLVLVEGYKRSNLPKIEVYRASANKPMLWPEDQRIIAVATDGTVETELPVLDLNRPEQVAQFIIDYFNLRKDVSGSAAA